jgi:hypothetical protein
MDEALTPGLLGTSPQPSPSQGEGAGGFSVDAFQALRLACETELHRLQLTWKHPRLKAFYQKVAGRDDAILADVPDGALVALLKKLKEEPTP